MSNEEAVQAKNDGAAAWSTGKFQLAADHFTTAINLGGDKEFLKILHSNRSAAYLKLNKITDALRDGNKCVELDSNWVKGYARKGDALLASKQYTEAYNAYNAGARISPNDATMKEKCEQAMRAMRNEAEATSSSARTASSAETSGASAPVYIQYCQIAILLCFFVYLVPFLSSTHRTLAHKMCVGLYAGLALNGLFKKYGFPKFSAEWAQRLIPDPMCMQLFLAVVLLMSKPYMFATAPVIISAVTTFTDKLLEYVRVQYPAVKAQMQPMIARFAPSLANVDISRMLGPSAAREMDRQLARVSAAMEAYHGLYLIFELVLPSRNIMQLYIWWQYLRLRYMIDTTGNLKLAFQGIDQRIQTILAMRMCPEVVRRGYGMLQAYLAKQVEMPTGGASATPTTPERGGIMGMLSKCSIM